MGSMKSRKWPLFLTILTNLTVTALADDESDKVSDFIPVKIVTSVSHTCVLSNKGQVKCWGANGSGELGIAAATSHGRDPGTMGPNLPMVNFGTNLYAKDICAGEQTTCIATTDDRVKCWGRNNNGQLGQERTKDVGRLANDMGDELPFTNLGTNFKAKSVHCGMATNCALSDAGKLKCWGRGSNYELGPDISPKTSIGSKADEMGDKLPFVALPAPVEHVSIGYAHVCAATKSDIYCWGTNATGQSGIESTAGRIALPADATQAMKVKLEDAGISTVIEDVSSGYGHNCALYHVADRVTEQKVKCWGENYAGSLGIGSTASNLGKNANTMGSKLPPTQLALGQITQLEVHGDFNCAMTKKGDAKCWGYNSNGNLGIGDSTSRGQKPTDMGTNLPMVDFGLPAIAMSSGTKSEATCAILINNEIKCWGAGASGVLGYEDNMARGNKKDDMGENLPFVRYK